jgi:hypothetical protein
MAFNHALLYSPTYNTLAKAIQSGFLNSIPGLTMDALRRHPPRSSAMVKGHLDQQRKNLRSTKTIHPNRFMPLMDQMDDDPIPMDDRDSTIDAIDTDAYPPTLGNDEHNHHCYTAIIAPTGSVHTDTTGRFITPSTN